MRLWTLHPKYLDARGLVAAWREALLAQAVLQGKTRGYRHHPQLIRFRACQRPVACLATYLRALHVEAKHRGYSFDAGKIATGVCAVRIPATRGQILYEWRHLRRKLGHRDPAWLARLRDVTHPVAHPLFRVRAGGIADWERIRHPAG